jgi:hypothetical protein
MGERGLRLVVVEVKLGAPERRMRVPIWEPQRYQQYRVGRAERTATQPQRSQSTENAYSVPSVNSVAFCPVPSA